ncbi:hypothetical protein DL95DRAFT_398881 [Leptodontidium sp. 2 PMI_412]|nr:hypothetical protein DL95DRAFT_398881 [Leptodontidium sp. 2 PMI_412]
MLSALPLLLVALVSGIVSSTPLANTNDIIATPVEAEWPLSQSVSHQLSNFLN